MYFFYEWILRKSQLQYPNYDITKYIASFIPSMLEDLIY